MAVMALPWQVMAADTSVLGNDWDLDGDALTITAVTQGTHGSVTIVGGGTGLTYDPEADYGGPDSFTYTISDGNGGTATATVNLTMTAVNDPPVAVADAYTTAEELVLTVAAPGVLGNDSDLEGDPLTVILVVGVSHGALALTADGAFAYTPTINYAGGDSFTYRANDGALDSNTVTVTLTVTEVPEPPAEETLIIYKGRIGTHFVVLIGYETTVDGITHLYGVHWLEYWRIGYYI